MRILHTCRFYIDFYSDCALENKTKGESIFIDLISTFEFVTEHCATYYVHFSLTSQNETMAARASYAGTHGFDNKLLSMKTIFVASGPSFKKGYRLESPIEQVDIYPLLCHLLKLEPAPHNGSLQRVTPLLDVSQDEDDSPDEALITTPSFLITSLSIIFGRAI